MIIEYHRVYLYVICIYFVLSSTMLLGGMANPWFRIDMNFQSMLHPKQLSIFLGVAPGNLTIVNHKVDLEVKRPSKLAEKVNPATWNLLKNATASSSIYF